MTFELRHGFSTFLRFYIAEGENFLGRTTHQAKVLYLALKTGKGKKSTIPKHVSSIGDYVFSGCRRLTSVTLPGGAVRIGNDIFAFCTELTEIRHGGSYKYSKIERFVWAIK